MSGEMTDRTKAQKLSSVISDLLNQQTHGAPILAGRKTSTMKKLEEKRREKKEQQLRRQERRQRVTSKITAPDKVNIEFERQLRRLATKGVVALFNAVAKAKRDGSKVSQLLKSNPVNSTSGNVVDEEERSVVSEISSSNSLIHKHSSTSSNSGSGNALKRGRAETGSTLHSKKRRIAEGWDQTNDEDDL